ERDGAAAERDRQCRRRHVRHRDVADPDREDVPRQYRRREAIQSRDQGRDERGRSVRDRMAGGSDLMRIGLCVLIAAGLFVASPVWADQGQQIDAAEIYLGSQPCRMLSGAGSPEGSVVAAPCSTYYRTSDGMIWRKAT